MSEYYDGGRKLSPAEVRARATREVTPQQDLAARSLEQRKQAALASVGKQTPRTRKPQTRHLKQGRWLGTDWKGKPETTHTPDARQDPVHFRGGHLATVGGTDSYMAAGTPLTLRYNSGHGRWQSRSHVGGVAAVGNAEARDWGGSKARRRHPHEGKVGTISQDSIAKIVAQQRK